MEKPEAKTAKKKTAPKAPKATTRKRTTRKKAEKPVEAVVETKVEETKVEETPVEVKVEKDHIDSKGLKFVSAVILLFLLVLVVVSVIDRTQATTEEPVVDPVSNIIMKDTTATDTILHASL